jgi:hypothetical protein
MSADTLLPNLDAAVEQLRKMGWTVLPPPAEEIPAPAAGEVWIAPSPRVEPRTVTKVASHRSYPWAGDQCVYFTVPSDPPDMKWPRVLAPTTWRAWAKKSGARPASSSRSPTPYAEERSR